MSASARGLARDPLGLACVGIIGMAGALAAPWLAELPARNLAGGLAAVLAGAAALWLARQKPGLLLGLLMALVLLQDPLVEAGLGPLQMGDEALVLMALAGLVLRAWRAGRLSRTPLDLPTLAFLLIAAVAALVRQVPPWIAALGILSLAKGLFAFHLAARLPDPARALRRGLPLLLGLAALTAAVALVQRIGGEGVYAAQGRLDYFLQWQGNKAPSIYFNHNALGHVMVLFGLTALALARGGVDGQGDRAGRPAAPRSERQRRERRWAGGLALLFLGGLVVSASRESWLAAVAGLMALAYLVPTRRTIGLTLGLSLLLTLSGLTVYFASPLLREEIARRTAGVWDGWRVYQMGYSGWGYRGEYRVYNLLKSWEVFQDYPLLGTGPGRFGGATAVRYLSPVYAEVDFLPLNGSYIPLDVFWSRLLTEFGLLGSAAYLAALAAYGRVARRAALGSGNRASRAGGTSAREPSREGDDPSRRALGQASAMTLAAILVLACLSPALEDPLAAIPFWALGGLCWALDRRGSGAPAQLADRGEGL